MPHRPRANQDADPRAQPSAHPQAYLAELRIAGRLCVVVGGGAVATRKALPLLAAGAQVRVVSPRLSPQLRTLASDDQLDWHEREYAPGDVQGALLVFAATNNAAVNRQVALDAHAAGALVNVADAPQRGDFSVPATLRRGDLGIAVTTSGTVPGYARRLRDLLAATLGPEFGEALRLYAVARPAILSAPSEQQAALWDRLFALDLTALTRASGSAAAEEALRAWREREGLA